MVVTQTISDSPDASAGQSAFIYDLTIENNGSGSVSVNPLYFTLISSSNSVYDTDECGACVSAVLAITLRPGQNTSGQLGFEIPDTQVPSELEFTNRMQGVREFVTSLPAPTSWVSSPEPSGQIKLTGPGSSEIVATCSVSNNTVYFYTGDVIAVKISLINLGQKSVTLTALNLTGPDAGFNLTSIGRPFPAIIPANGHAVSVYVYIASPPSSFTGEIELEGTTSQIVL